jgi:hypothetical protein
MKIRASANDWEVLRKSLFTTDGHENAAGLLCSTVDEPNCTTLLVRRCIPVPKTEYRKRLKYHLEIAPSFYNSLVDVCLEADANLVIVHSHPFDGSAEYSSSDDFGESRLLPTLMSLLPGKHVASLLLTRTSASVTCPQSSHSCNYEQS